eukprot:512098-Prymnesium_polylepis.1
MSPHVTPWQAVHVFSALLALSLFPCLTGGPALLWRRLALFGARSPPRPQPVTCRARGAHDPRHVAAPLPGAHMAPATSPPRLPGAHISPIVAPSSHQHPISVSTDDAHHHLISIPS